MITICRCSKHFITLFLVLSSQAISYATDAINSSQIIRDDGNTTLISSGGTFELGFFSPESSKNRYVGIWYKQIPQKTVVWVANRDDPLEYGSGMLQLIGSGQRLVLLNGTNGIIWSTNASRNAQNPVAQLLNSGNLVLKDADDDNSENFQWQSFDYPMDALLPGMKLGWNFRTGHEVYITSRKNSGDPATGDYTYRLEPTEYPQLVIHIIIQPCLTIRELLFIRRQN